MNANAASTSQPIDIDLPCVKCGYNLRTLASSAACSECGTPVAESTLLPGFRFQSRRAARRVRRGLGILVIAVLVWALSQLGLWFICRFFIQLKSTAWTPTLVSAWGYSSDASFLLRHLAVLMICFPFGPRHCNAYRRMSLVAGMFALLASAALIAPRVFDLGSAISTPHLVVRHGLIHCTAISVVLSLIFIAWHVRRPAMSRLRTLLWAAIGAGIVGVGIGVFVSVHSLSTWAAFENGLSPTSSRLLEQVELAASWIAEHVLPFCWPVILVAIGLYYRRLNSTLRLPDGDRIVQAGSAST